MPSNYVLNDPYANTSTITGGTGRFAGASGLLETEGCFGLDTAGNVWITGTTTGTISY